MKDDDGEYAELSVRFDLACIDDRVLVVRLLFEVDLSIDC